MMDINVRTKRTRNCVKQLVAKVYRSSSPFNYNTMRIIIVIVITTAIIYVKTIARVHSGHLDERGLAPGGRQLKAKLQT